MSLFSNPQNNRTSGYEDLFDCPLSREQHMSRDQLESLVDFVLSDETNPAAGEAYIHLGAEINYNDQPSIENMQSFINSIGKRALEKREQACRAICESVGAPELALPGFGLPLNYLPSRQEDPDSTYKRQVPDHFLLLHADSQELNAFSAATLLIRESCMLKVVEDLTNKPEWWLKCRDPRISDRWKSEMLAVDWTQYHRHADFTPAMTDFVIAELRYKAKLYEETGLIPVMDYSATAIKSDRVLTDELTAALIAAVAPLENVPEKMKDWHPGSKKQVLDIVHPSMWPLVYGRSRIRPDRRIGVHDAIELCGTGSVLPSAKAFKKGRDDNMSNRFQWLPCDIALSTDGTAKIESYINNVHPVHHASLYPVIEQLIQKSLPAWDVVYKWPSELEMQRLQTLNAYPQCPDEKVCQYDCKPYNRPLNEGEEERDEDESFEDGYEDTPRGKLDWIWFKETHPLDLPDPPSNPPEPPAAGSPWTLETSDVLKQGFFDGASRVQVIVKLANIHLTPEAPSYAGGSWHIEGLLNEHICATALYYYDSENVTESCLDFRTRADREELMGELKYQQGDYDTIERIFDMSSFDQAGPGHTSEGEEPRRQHDGPGSTTQPIGSVLTRPGRALFFPNVYQHHVSPFRLEDPSRPGHRKIVALFLVDPRIRIISTANVPPQRKDWWLDATRLGMPNSGGDLAKLPLELMTMVNDELDWPIGREEAEKIREELMAERSQAVEDTNGFLAQYDYNFCEH